MRTVAEIEAALSEMSAEGLAQVEAALRRLRDECGNAAVERDLAELERRSGFDVFPRRAGAPVSIEIVRRLCAEEDA